jgi:methylthioribulose-1-phosphate dehydratase
LNTLSITDAASTEARALVECISRLYGRRWCDGTSGNFSLVVHRDPLRLLITRTGLDKGRVDVSDLLLVGAHGRPIEGETHKPSAETLLHVAIAHETDASVILHTHSIWNTLLSEHFLDQRGLTISGYEMLKGIEGVRGHREQVFVPILKNSQDIPALAESVVRVLGRRPGLRGLLIAGHGLYSWGTSVESAYRQVEAFEFLFQVVWRKLSVTPIA